MPEIAVVGTGMAGCGAAYRLHTESITPVCAIRTHITTATQRPFASLAASYLILARRGAAARAHA
jgi:glycine/D-amino acid oxidase-like deaminating enzyme